MEPAMPESPDGAGVYGGIEPAQPSAPHLLTRMIRRALAKKRVENAAEEAEKSMDDRATDDATMPYIMQDHVQRIQHQEKLTAAMENVLTPGMAEQKQKAEQAKQQQDALMGQLGGMVAPQQQRGQLGIQDIISAGIASLFGGAQGMNQALEGGFQRAGQDAQMQYQNEVQAQEQKREQVMLQLRQLGVDEQTAQRAYEVLQGRQFGLQDTADKRRYDAGENEKNREVKITLEEMKQQGKLDLKAVDAYKAVYGKMKPEMRSQAVAAMLASLGRQVPPELLQAVNELNTKDELDRANTRIVTLRGDEQVIKNQYAERVIQSTLDSEESRRNLNDATRLFIDEKRKQYPNYLAALMGRMTVQNAAAYNGINNSNFDREAKEFEMKFGRELEAIDKRVVQIDEELVKAEAAQAEALAGWKANPDKREFFDASVETGKVVDRLKKEKAEKEARRTKINTRAGSFVPASAAQMGLAPNGMLPGVITDGGSFVEPARNPGSRTPATKPRTKTTPPKGGKGGGTSVRLPNGADVKFREK